MNTVRTFIAIELTDNIKNLVRLIQSDLKTTGCDAKWVKPKNAHITLKFLGNTPVEKIPEIENILSERVGNISSFTIATTELGAFPKKETPRTLWLGTEEKPAVLKDLTKLLEDDLEKLGFSKEGRGFKPHITIGRAKSDKNINALVNKIKEYNIDMEIIQQVKKICLIKSTLTGQGPVYETIYQAEFKRRHNL